MSKASPIVQHYESCFDRHGDSLKGVDWPNESDALKRYQVMWELTRGGTGTLLDYGCGLGHFYAFLKDRKQLQKIKYAGVDASPKFVEHCKKKFKDVPFALCDVLEDDFSLPKKKYDFIVLNGVLTEKREITQKKMVSVFHEVVGRLFPLCKKGLAFNVMTKLVDWERDDLFHLDFNSMSEFISKNLSRHFCVRHDYGLYEYTVYVYKQPAVEIWQS